jgi:UDP-2-acetamido-3-amino-2,3-dideoxy-glucuronate N-acetyltransferase
MSAPDTHTRRIAPDVKLGQDVIVRDFVNLYGCEIGDHTHIGTFVEIQKGVRVGRHCKIQSHTFICEGVAIGDNVFIGHNVTFINDRFPRAVRGDGRLQTDEDWTCIPTVVRSGASIGSSVTILCGVTIGEDALLGAGSVVTKDVPAGAVVAGNPARVLRVSARGKPGQETEHAEPMREKPPARTPQSETDVQDGNAGLATGWPGVEVPAL